MPLQSGSGRAAFEHNVKAEIEAGKPQRQAVAIAFSKKGEDAWQPKPLPKGVFNWKVTYAVHGDESQTSTRVVKAKTEKDAFDEFFRYARGHDRPIKIEKMRDSLSAISMDALVVDGLAERIAGARALYNRPGTPGEKEAAAAALRRMGIDPNTLGSSASPEPARSAPPKPRPTSSQRTYRVILQYVWTNKMGVTKTMETSPFVTEARDRIEAESKARADAMYSWRMTVGGRPPEFRAYSTTRVGDVAFEGQESTMRKYSGGDSLSAIARDALMKRSGAGDSLADLVEQARGGIRGQTGDALSVGQNTKQRVIEALKKGGYTNTGITSAQFKGMNSSGSEIHRITFLNDDTGKQNSGNVYIDKNGNGDF